MATAEFDSYLRRNASKDDGFLTRLPEIYFRYEWALFIALGILQLVPIWGIHYFPTLDGPLHVGNMLTYMRMDEPGYEVLRLLYQPAHNISPNYFVYIFLYGALQIFSPLVSEKLFLSLYVLSVPLAFRYALCALGRNATVFSVLGFPMAYTILIFLGFYNTSFALVAFLLTVGYWFRHRNEASWRVFAGYFFLALFCFFVHLSAVAMTGIFIGLTGTAETLFDYLDARRNGSVSRSELWRRFGSRCVVPGLAYVLPAVGTVMFFLRPPAMAVSVGVGEPTALFYMRLPWMTEGPVGDSASEPTLSLFVRLVWLLKGPTAIAFDQTEMFIAFPFVAGLILAFSHMAGNLSRRTFLRDPLFIAVIGLLLLYLFLPYNTVVRWIPFRLMPYVFLGIFLWLGSAALTLSGRARGLLYSFILIAALLSALATAVLRPMSMARVNDFLDEYVSAFEYIEPGSTVLPIVMNSEFNGESMSGHAGISIFYQSQHYLIWEKPAGILLNGQANVNYFPIVFRPAVNPFAYFKGLLPEFGGHRNFDLEGYLEKTGVPVDYVILWGEGQNIPPPQEWPESVFFSQLATNYEQVYRSPQRGLQRVYRRKTD